MEITNINQLDVTNGLYTYADYLLWCVMAGAGLILKIFPLMSSKRSSNFQSR